MAFTVHNEIVAEEYNAFLKFGDQQWLSNLDWFAILAEEFGEVGRHVTQTEVPPITNPELTPQMLRNELIQVAAVCVRWINMIDKKRNPAFATFNFQPPRLRKHLISGDKEWCLECGKWRDDPIHS